MSKVSKDYFRALAGLGSSPSAPAKSRSCSASASSALAQTVSSHAP